MSSDSASKDANSSFDILQQEINKINEILNLVIFNNRNLKKDIDELTVENNNLYDLLYDMEIKTDSMNQYSRCNNIEICNIPEKIAQRNLEQYVLKMLESSSGINLVSYDLVVVHRVGKLLTGKNRNVIVRFLNRKNAYTSSSSSSFV